MSDSSSRAIADASLKEDTVDLEVLPSAPTHPRRMLDRYEIIAEIAKGGMGTVYLARLSGAGGFERLMALKVMHEHLAEDDAFVTMLLDEARTAAHIHHPNAVGITDVVESPVGYYLVMDYVDGFPLSHIVTHPDLSERDRIRLGTRLIVDAAAGLHAAHSAKDPMGRKLEIVHRDVSPQNVLVGRDGSGRIVDFGIALAASRVASSRPGTLKGKPQYMAPEQAKGEPCDARTDVFALGIIFWEVLTYERLFYGEMDVAVLVQVMDCVIPSPRERNPNIPEALAQVALKALSKNPSDRYATARDFGAALEAAAAQCDLFANHAETEALIATHFEEEITAKDEAVRAHLDRSVGETAPMRRGELGLVSKLFMRKRTSKLREMHTRTGQGLPSNPTSGVRSRGSIEPSVAPTAAATPSAQRAASKSPSLVLVSIAVIAALAILSIGAYALSNALQARPAEVSTELLVAEPVAAEPVGAEPVGADPVITEAPAVETTSAEASVPGAESAEEEAFPSEAVPAPEAEAPAEPAARPTLRHRDRPAPTEPEPVRRTGPTIEANPYLGH